MTEDPSVAEQALKKLGDQLTCAICLEDYKDPKLLQCFHVYCKDCLERLVLQDRQGLSLRCPSCRRSTLLPPNSISGLQPAFHIHHLFEIRDALEKIKKVKGPQKTQCDKCKKRDAINFCRTCQFICTKCTEFHQEWEDFSTHKVISLSQLEEDMIQLVPPTKKLTYCSQHPTKESDLYCETCDELICRDCIVRVHRDHQCDLIPVVFSKHKDMIVDRLQPVKQQLGVVNEAIESLDTRRQAISDQRMAIETDIHKAIRQLQEALEKRKTELIGQLDQQAQQKLKSLAAQRDEFERIQTRLSSCLNFVNESLRTGSQAEILAVKKPVVQQIEGMTAEFKPDALALVEQADLKFTATTELTPACKQFGKVYAHPVSPQKCHSTCKDLEVVTVDKQATASLYTVDTEDIDWNKPVDVNCELTSCTASTSVKGSVKKREGNRYDISYQPTTRGRHQLHIKVEGQHIRGSPFAVVALGKSGTPIRTIKDVKSPRGITFNKSGQIIVAEGGAGCLCLSIIDVHGTRIRTIAAEGSIDSPYIYPCGIAIDDGDNIFVADSKQHAIWKFVTGDRVTSSVTGTQGKGPLQFDHPAGIGANPKIKKIYVCDCFNDRVQILNNDITFSSSFGSSGSGDGQFNCPSDVALDSADNVFIADSNNHRVQIFTSEGQFLRKFGKEGKGKGELKTPVGITVDSNDMVYVTEHGNCRVSVFTSQGQFLTTFGAGLFRQTFTNAVDKEGFLYACDNGNNCILIF